MLYLSYNVIIRKTMNLLNKPFTENGNYLYTWDLQEKIALKLDIEGKNFPKTAKSYVQCLLENQAKDVTENITINDNKLIVDGRNLRLWGRKSADAIGDSEDPALILQIII